MHMLMNVINSGESNQKILINSEKEVVSIYNHLVTSGGTSTEILGGQKGGKKFFWRGKKKFFARSARKILDFEGQIDLKIT